MRVVFSDLAKRELDDATNPCHGGCALTQKA